MLPRAKHVATSAQRVVQRWVPVAHWPLAAMYAVAAIFVAVLLPVTITVLSRGYGVNGGIAAVLGITQTLPLLLAVRKPLYAWGIIFVSYVAGALALLSVGLDADAVWPWPPIVTVGYTLLCLFLGMGERRWVLIAVWALTAVASSAFSAIPVEHNTASAPTLTTLSAVALFVGALVRERREVRILLAEQRTISEAEHAQRTLLEERARIARELHDVVAHHMSVITVQAESAPYRVPELPDSAAEEFRSIATSARESLHEMRLLLAVMRSDVASSERTPQPGLEQLPQLIEAVQRTGASVELSIELPEEDSARMSSAVELTLYRIAQEALANIVRHATGAAVQILLNGDSEALTLTIRNTAPPTPTSVVEKNSGGQGIRSMRERAQLVGGSLETEPLPDGGFCVTAHLPFTDKEESEI